MADDHGNANGVFVEALFLPDAVVACHFAVVADVDDDGVVAQGGVVDDVEEAANEVIGKGDEAIVGGGCGGGDSVV